MPRGGCRDIAGVFAARNRYIDIRMSESRVPIFRKPFEPSYLTFRWALLLRGYRGSVGASENQALKAPLTPVSGPVDRPWRLGIWLSAGAMLLCLFGKSDPIDNEFWHSWILEFQTAGYQGLSANYPPLLLHWLRLVAWTFSAIGITPQNSMLIKVVVTFPTLLCQLAFVDLVGRRLAQLGEAPQQSGLFWLAVFNPALLANGPIWGQVDLLPILPAYFAVTSATERARAVWALPWLVVALLTKMQSIVVVPVIAGLALRHFRQQVLGALIAIAIIALGFLPFALAGADVFDALGRAYWGNLSLYPFSTIDAANLWYLVVGKSMQPHDLSVLSSDCFPGWLVDLATPRKLGLLSYSILSLALMISAFRNTSRQYVLGLTVVSATGFFAFSSGMHERYLFFAAAFAALWGCEAPHRRHWYPLLTALLYVNMNFALNFFGHRFLRLVSAVVVLTFFGLGCQAMFQSNRLDRGYFCLCACAERHPWAPYLAFTALWLILAASLVVSQLHNSGNTLSS